MAQKDEMIDETWVIELHDEIGANATKYKTQVFLLKVSDAVTKLTNNTPRDIL